MTDEIDIGEGTVERFSHYAECCAISEGLGKDYAHIMRTLRAKLTEAEAKVEALWKLNADLVDKGTRDAALVEAIEKLKAILVACQEMDKRTGIAAIQLAITNIEALRAAPEKGALERLTHDHQ